MIPAATSVRAEPSGTAPFPGRALRAIPLAPLSPGLMEHGAAYNRSRISQGFLLAALSASILLSCFAGALKAQPPATATIDLGDPYTIPYLASTSLNTDGVVCLLSKYTPGTSNGDSAVVTTFSFEQGVLWSQLLKPVDASNLFDATRVLRMSNGGTMVLGVLHRPDEPIQHVLVRFDAAGNMQSALSMSVEGTTINQSDYGSSALHEIPGQGLLISLAYGHKPVVVLLADDGTITWSRSFITTDPTPKNPSFDFAVLSDGGALLTQKAEGDPFLIRVNASGEVQWAFRYTNGLYTHTKTAIEVEGGDIVITGFQGDHAFAARLGPDGAIVWWRSIVAQVADYAPGFRRIAQLANGDLLFTSEAPELFGTTSGGAVLLNGSGEPVRAWAAGTPIAQGITLAGLIGEHMVIAGHASFINDDEQVISELRLAQLDLRTTDYCSFVQDEVTVTDAPIPPILSGGIQVQEEVVTLGVANVAARALAMSAAPDCDLTVHLPTPPDKPVLQVVPNLVNRGGVVQVFPPEPFIQLTILNAVGQTVRRYDLGAGGAATLAVDLASGSYLFVATGPSGTAQGHARVVVH